MNDTDRSARETRRIQALHGYETPEIIALPVKELALPQSHLYLWVPNALVHLGLNVPRV